MASGYRKLSDGSWEQPTDALKRVQRRSLLNIFGGCVVTAVTVAGLSVGISHCSESIANSSIAHAKKDRDQEELPEQSISRQIALRQANEEAGLGFLYLTSSVLFGAAGGFFSISRISRDLKSKEGIRRDIDRGMYFDKKGNFIDPHQFYRTQEDVQQQFVTTFPENPVFKDIAPR